MNSLNELNSASVLRFGPYAFHLRQRLILEGDRQLRMGGRALDILQVLVERAGQVVSKEQLIALVWPTSVVEEINLRVHIAALRRALGEGENGQRYIVNVPQRGYSFVAPVQGDSVTQVVFENLQAPQHNLPARLTPVTGRDSLVGGLVRQLPLSRLLTVTGPAGVGKSTVALRAAELLLQHFRDGVWQVDLSLIDENIPLLDHLLKTLDLDFPTLAARHALLVLDNCDHLHQACRSLLQTLLDAAPRLSILATSREPLRLALEVLQPLAPLTLPKASALNSVAEVMGYSAVQLFVSRARARQHGFSLREQDLETVRDICRRLDGLPLAIELAAAQIDALALVGLQTQLDQGLQVLSHGRRTAVPRHQSMKAALDWSYQRLSEQEQRVLQRLSVFKMAFTLDAAIGVISCAQLPPSTLVAVVEQLAAKSLLTTDRSSGTLRYRMLNITRRYAREQLEQGGELNDVERRHARYLGRTRPVSSGRLTAQFVEQ
ncbi:MULTISPECIES: ATP-binding protein [Pseudomonas]|uniref:Putative transcriptional regulator n=1 Tax=Pseudomonas fluorescens (strain Pf0-1) TaxID=205922 RepID=Q3KEV6_PSEPF|nr:MULTISPECIES: winged helix-turn-helix domain-containing protein [Pseudomonas]ABA73700.1 putative transcriptional regulator [Pseudomonas fluorescens Pf0-1]MBL0795399.1 helix-turn-helix transcriptional regulator [Pseudomonas sp. B7]MBY9025148.1 helix-turn-helix transcriptional regulator [Pseudomonas fluorescens]MBY9031938.1 helix-turn-helix transcriptional regulator [Pseudomonas fluorescens]MBY9036374.1 helix-turn-helix transcriptional regulator [Pseudomonas fluorescens]